MSFEVRSQRRRLCTRAQWAGLIAILSAGCVPEVGPPASLLLGPRVVAVRSEPAEVAPGESAQLTLFVAEPGVGSPGSLDVALRDAEWALCLAPKPPVDNNFISGRCLNEDSAVNRLATRGTRVEVQIPMNSCALFGPQTPPQESGQPPARPRDPDSTGGYYQPVRVRVPALGLLALAGVRVLCGLPSATPETAAAYRAQYVRNRNPEIASLDALYQDAPQPLTQIQAGTSISLRLFPRTDSAETFLYFDPGGQVLTRQQEALRVSWFSGQGHFNLATTMSDSQGAAITNEWTAPASPGSVLLWTVLRDSRGGTAVVQQPVQVQ